MNTSYCLPALRRLSLLAGLLVVLASTLSAKAPEPPTLGVSVSSVPGTTLSTIRLEWKPGAGSDAATAYRIYQSKPAGPNGNEEFTPIGTTGEMVYEIGDLPPGVYFAFYVTAYNADGESGQSNIVKAGTDGQSDPGSRINFTSKPEFEATVGSLYSFRAEAIDAEGGTVLYKMTGSPLGAPIPDAEGMTIDRRTGVVEWMPKTQGTFAAAIVAYLESDTTVSAMQVLVITVRAPACAMIRGMVRDSTGAAVENGWITAVYSDGRGGTDWNTSSAAELVAGRYALPVSEGTYILYLKHERIGAIWYGNATDVADAERVVVACGDTIQANFSVTIPPPPTYFVVSGRVTATSDGRGVPATVYFMSRDKAGRMLPPDKGVVSPDGMMTTTDADGNYSIELSDEFGYIAQALPDGDELLPQYYNRVSNPTEATPITIATGRKLVNFSLLPRPVYINSIAGSVRDTTGAALSSQVIAIRIPDGTSGADPMKEEFARSTATSDDGTFTLKNLLPGEYVLLAIPASRDYVPGYFLSGGMAALGWNDASRIRMGETSNSAANAITLAGRNGIKGFAKLSGYIKVAPGAKRSRTITGYDQLPGVFVYALDPDNRVSDYVFSDPSGYFELSELGATDYRIVADKVGYLSQVISTAVDYQDNASAEKDLMMSRGASIVDEEVAGQGSLSLYPNPAGERLMVRFEAEAGAATLAIVDIFGRTVRTTAVDAIDGTNNVVIDISTLATGSYRARLRSGATSRSVPLTIVR